MYKKDKFLRFIKIEKKKKKYHNFIKKHLKKILFYLLKN